MFMLEEPTGIELLGEETGLIPTPEWKAEKFDGDIWRLGDTYITAIGQYGTQLTPLEAVRFVAAIANKGRVLKPTLLASSTPVAVRTISFRDEDWKVVRDGMNNPCGFDVLCIGPTVDITTGKACPIDVRTGLPWADPVEAVS